MNKIADILAICSVGILVIGALVLLYWLRVYA